MKQAAKALFWAMISVLSFSVMTNIVDYDGNIAPWLHSITGLIPSFFRYGVAMFSIIATAAIGIISLVLCGWSLFVQE